VVAVALNFPWEMAQSFLYVRPSALLALWFCFLATLGDGLLVLLIFAFGWMVLRQRDWFQRPGPSGYLLMLVSGLLISITVEWIAVHLAGKWTYTERMPLLPGFNVGLLPVVQSLVLPALIFRTAASWVRRLEE
jgi:hypothetical protein